MNNRIMGTPTQAQIEAAAKAIRLRDSTDEFAIARAALTAAAQVGEQERHDAQVDRYILMAHVTIERCAQVAEKYDEFVTSFPEQRKRIAAAIRKLKDTTEKGNEQ